MTGHAGKQDEILSVTTTVAGQDAARQLADRVLARRLAACVQVEPGLVSHYRWEGRLQAEPEVRLTFKTTPGGWAAMQDFLAEHHPYEVPQVLGQVMKASPAYAAWVRAEVAPDLSAPEDAAPGRRP